MGTLDDDDLGYFTLREGGTAVPSADVAALPIYHAMMLQYVPIDNDLVVDADIGDVLTYDGLFPVITNMVPVLSLKPILGMKTIPTRTKIFL